MTAMEFQLGVWASLELGLSGTAIRMAAELNRAENLNLQSLDGSPRIGSDRTMWERWNSARADFYKQSAKLVSSLSWSDALTVAGSECLALGNELKKAAERLADSPTHRRLRAVPLRILHDDATVVTVVGHTDTDPYTMNRRLAEVLYLFNGAEVPAAIQAVRLSTGIDVTDQQLDDLVQWGCLVPDSEPVHTSNS